MVLEIQLFREDFGGDPDFLKESQKRRFQSEEDVDEVIETDNIWRKAKYEVDQANAEVNKLNIVMRDRFRNKEPVDDVATERKALLSKIEVLSKQSSEAEKIASDKLRKIGNIVHQTVPVSNEAKQGTLLRAVGNISKREGLKSYSEILQEIKGVDFDRGTNICGKTGYFLTGIVVQLNYALQRYALNYLYKRGCTLLQSPHFMRETLTKEVVTSSESLYKVYTHEEAQYSMISSMRHSMAAYHQSEWIEAKELPKKYAVVSTCFKNTQLKQEEEEEKDLFSTFQFESVDQLYFSPPEKSWNMLEEMLVTAEEFFTTLELPYQVMTTVSGLLQLDESKKYEIQVYFPHSDKFKEVSSCCNLTDYLSRNFGIRYASKKQKTAMKKYVHMVSNNMCPTEKIICAILENHQTKEGIKIPKVLQPYFDNGRDFIPFETPKISNNNNDN